MGDDPGFAFEAGRLLAVPADGRYVVVLVEPASRDADAGRRLRELMHCHRNTVLNRLRRLYEATGHDLTTGTTPVELALALRAADRR